MAKVITTELQHAGASAANITLDSSKNVTCENNLTVDGTSILTGAVTLPSDTVDEAKLKVSNSPTNGQFLSAQSGNTGGLTWADAGGVSSRGAFMAGGSGTNQDVAHNTTVTMEFAEVFDQDGWYDDSTNIYTPQVAGYYWFSLSCWFNNYPNTDNCEMSLGTHIRKNDSTNYSTQMEGSNDWFESYTCRTSSILLLMNGSSDNVRFQVYQWNGNSETTKLDKSESFVSGFLVHAT